MKLKAFRVAQNKTPKMAKMAVSTNTFSHFSAEHTDAKICMTDSQEGDLLAHKMILKIRVLN